MYAWTDIHWALPCAIDARALPLCAPAATRPVNAVETHGVRLPIKKYNHAGGNTNVLRGDARHGDARRASLHGDTQYVATIHTNQINHPKITVQTKDAINHKNPSNHLKITS
jgi:hypothetical protein